MTSVFSELMQEHIERESREEAHPSCVYLPADQREALRETLREMVSFPTGLPPLPQGEIRLAGVSYRLAPEHDDQEVQP